MRITVAIQLCVALLLSLAEAPFFHVHDDHSDHHQGLVAHTHLAARTSNEQTGIGSDDEGSDAKELNWFQLEPPAPQPIAIALTASYSVEIPPVIAVRIHRERSRIHGPPASASLHSRAPPA